MENGLVAVIVRYLAAIDSLGLSTIRRAINAGMPIRKDRVVYSQLLAMDLIDESGSFIDKDETEAAVMHVINERVKSGTWYE